MKEFICGAKGVIITALPSAASTTSSSVPTMNAPSLRGKYYYSRYATFCAVDIWTSLLCPFTAFSRLVVEFHTVGMLLLLSARRPPLTPSTLLFASSVNSPITSTTRENISRRIIRSIYVNSLFWYPVIRVAFYISWVYYTQTSWDSFIRV